MIRNHKFKILTALVAVGVIALVAMPIIIPAVHFAVSHPLCGALPAMALPFLGMADTIPMEEFQGRVLRGIRSVEERVGDYDSEIRGLKEHINRLDGGSTDSRRAQIRALGMAGTIPDPRLFNSKGLRRQISDEAAINLLSAVVLRAQQCGKLDAWINDQDKCRNLLGIARDVSGISQRALSTTEIPLPTAWGNEVRELIATYGVARDNMFYYPMTSGVDKPARMGTRPAFGSIAMSAAFSEKKPTIDFATLENHKIGGITIVPREIDDQSAVAMGKYLAMYGAKEFAKAEDTWAFLADGSGTYETVKGICQICKDNASASLVQLASTKTHASDATLADFRAMRAKVSTGALGGAKYYLHHTWEAQLRTFKTAADACFQDMPDGTSRLDGFPIVWTEPLQPYGTTVTVNAYLAVFGNLEYWYFGERGTPRIDTSEHVYFANDQLAVRFIEEIDFDYVNIAATSALQTAAS